MQSSHFDVVRTYHDGRSRVTQLAFLANALKEVVLVALPHGGQRGARRNAWHAMIAIQAPGGSRTTGKKQSLGSSVAAMAGQPRAGDEA